MTSLLPAPESPPGFERFHLSGAVVDDVLVVSLSGEVDIASQATVREFVHLEVEACPGTLVIDMAAVTFVDSTGLSMLIEAHRAVTENGGKVVVRSPNEQFRHLLRITGVDQLVTIQD